MCIPPSPQLHPYPQLLPKLMKKWAPTRDSSREYLTNLVTAAHDMFKMAKSLAEEGAVVLTHRRKTKAKVPKKDEEGVCCMRMLLRLRLCACA